MFAIARNIPTTEVRAPGRPTPVGIGSTTFELAGARADYGRNSEIFGEGEEVEFVYKVVSGAVRTSKILTDGRRQIGAFHLPGDVFGMEAGDEHLFSAEAIGPTVVLLMKRTALLGIAERDAELGRELWASAARDLSRAQQHMLLLGRKSAVERVAAFLMEMADRTGCQDVLELPMSRQDIADYLGLTIETVSRTFTSLEERNAIALPASRRVVLRNRAALRRLDS